MDIRTCYKVAFIPWDTDVRIGRSWGAGCGLGLDDAAVCDYRVGVTTLAPAGTLLFVYKTVVDAMELGSYGRSLIYRCIAPWLTRAEYQGPPDVDGRRAFWALYDVSPEPGPGTRGQRPVAWGPELMHRIDSVWDGSVYWVPSVTPISIEYVAKHGFTTTERKVLREQQEEVS